MSKSKSETVRTEPLSVPGEASEIEAMPDTVPSRRLVRDGDTVRVRRPPYPSTQSDPSTGAAAQAQEHFPVDWTPTSTLPSGLRSVSLEAAEAKMSRLETQRAAPVEKGKIGPYARYEHRRRVHPRIRRRSRRVTPTVDRQPRGLPEEMPGVPDSRDMAIRVPLQLAFGQLSYAARHLLRRGANRVELDDGEQASFGMAYLVRGRLCAHPGPLPTCALSLRAGTILRSLPPGGPSVDTRWLACGGPCTLVTWDLATTERVLWLTPRLEACLRMAAHRIDAQVCASMGPLGEIVCASMREDLFAQSTLRVLRGGEVLFGRGDALPGLVIAGAGGLDQVDADGQETSLLAGDVACATAVLNESRSPVTLRARDGGASVLIAHRSAVLELACAMPSLFELIARC